MTIFIIHLLSIAYHLDAIMSRHTHGLLNDSYVGQGGNLNYTDDNDEIQDGDGDISSPKHGASALLSTGPIITFCVDARVAFAMLLLMLANERESRK